MVCFRFALLESGRRVTYEKLGDQNSALGFISSLLFDLDTFLLISIYIYIFLFYKLA